MKKKCAIWLFGRGASIDCGLTWTVPDEWKKKEREEQIRYIKKDITNAMEKIEVGKTVYKPFLALLASHASPNWHHRFVTTNWDYLLQREINSLSLSVLPEWLSSSHVFHLNGSVEPIKDNSNRSPFLLETDPPKARISTPEANMAFNYAIWNRMFIVVGMSFKCEMDKYFLNAIHAVHDDLPIGESDWIILNPNKAELEIVVMQVQETLPLSNIHQVPKTFGDWISAGMRELQEKGILLNSLFLE